MKPLPELSLALSPYVGEPTGTAGEIYFTAGTRYVGRIQADRIHEHDECIVAILTEILGPAVSSVQRHSQGWHSLDFSGLKFVTYFKDYNNNRETYVACVLMQAEDIRRRENANRIVLIARDRKE